MNHQNQSPRFSDTRLSSGLRLRYAEQGDPETQPIILLHGMTDTWYSFSRIMPALAEAGHIYALEQRGHGDSDRPAQGYSMSDFAGDVVAFMDALGLPSAVLVGHSMGSLVALQAAINAPQRVAGLVLIGSGTNVRTQELFEFHQALEELDGLVPAEIAREFQASTIYWPVPDEFLDRVVTECQKAPARVWHAALAGCLAADYSTSLHKIRMSTLILRGEQDTVFPRAAQDALASGIPQAVLRVYPETGHALHWERPEQIAKDLKAFIQK
jgi:non-heme chloroperoxidase